jgi:tyrosyl-tRNA synthetase
MDKIADLVNPDRTHPKEAKILLGKTIVTQFYDRTVAEAAAAEFDRVFAQKNLPDEIPQVQISPQPIAASKLLLACKLVPSGSEAKRMIKQGAVEIDGTKIDDPNAEITPKDSMVIQVGKRKFARLKVK